MSRIKFRVVGGIFLSNILFGCGGSSGGAAASATTVEGFFQLIKGSYEYFASKDGGGDDVTWTDGSKYLIAVTAEDKTVTFATNDASIVVGYDDDARNTYEASDHEQTAIMHNDAAKILVQRQDEKVYFTYGNAANWQFNDVAPGESLPVFEAEGITYTVGPKFEEALTSVMGTTNPRWGLGDTISVEIDNTTGAVTSTFGDFTWEHHQVGTQSISGKAAHAISWCKPSCDKSIIPREVLRITVFPDESLYDIAYSDIASSDTHHYIYRK